MGKAKRRKQRKPTGEVGYLKVPPDSGETPFRRFVFPTQKEEIERHILAGVLETSRLRGLDLYGLTSEPVKNTEDDFDFTLPTTVGTQYLDLVEFAPIAGPIGAHANGPLSYVVEQRGNEVIATIRKKAERYPKTAACLHLILYSTDYRFRVDVPVTDWVSLWCHSNPHPFTTIYYYYPEEEHSGQLSVVFPRPQTELAALRPDEFGQRQIATADLSRGERGAKGEVIAKIGPMNTPGPGPVRISIRARLRREGEDT